MTVVVVVVVIVIVVVNSSFVDSVIAFRIPQSNGVKDRLVEIVLLLLYHVVDAVYVVLIVSIMCNTSRAAFIVLKQGVWLLRLQQLMLVVLSWLAVVLPETPVMSNRVSMLHAQGS